MALECSEPRTERKQLGQSDRTGHDTDYPLLQKPLAVPFAFREEKKPLMAYNLYASLFHLFKITTFSPPFSEFSDLDCVIVPSGCVHENKPDTQVVRGEVEAHNVVGAT